MFLCPKCGDHSVICWFVNPKQGAPVPPETTPGPGRWTRSGETIESLTLLGSGPGGSGMRSVQLGGGGCQAHFYVTDGQVSVA